MNPMGASAGKGGAGKEMAQAVAKQALANTVKRSVHKQDLSKEFQQASFIDSREKIISLS